MLVEFLEGLALALDLRLARPEPPGEVLHLVEHDHEKGADERGGQLALGGGDEILDAHDVPAMVF